MKPILIAGSGLVTLALIAYSIGIITEQRNRSLTWRVLMFLGLGLIFDISGTICMIIGSANSPFTFHGVIGYSALMAMFLDNLLLWRLKSKHGMNSSVTKTVHMFSRISYLWWVVVYVSGVVRSMYF